MNLKTIPREDLVLAANTLRVLSAEAVEKANSGHPGMPMGMADIAAVLWLKYLTFNSAQPEWLNRDRFVLSNGHGSMLLYSLLYLNGYKVSLDDLKKFRQWDSITPGHPEAHITPGVEATTGPLGQGISNAVGMAIGQKLLRSRYFGASPELLNHSVVVFAGDGCMMEGVSSEAGSLAGHLGLGNLVVVYDDNHISIAGHTELAFTEDVLKRYEAYGWRTERIDGHNFDAIDQALATALEKKNEERGRPTLIAARTIIGKGSPNKSDTEEVHGSPLGKEELALAKRELNWPSEESFFVPPKVAQLFAARQEELRNMYGEWQEKFRRWNSGNEALALQLGAQLDRRVPADLTKKLLAALPSPPAPAATRKLSSEVLQAASREVPSLVGGSADLEPSTFTLIKKSTDIRKGDFSGLNLRFGVREHGMGATMNGLACYGGFIPYGSTFLVFSDYMRPAIRLAALTRLQSLFIFTHDSVFLGEDGPTHQPIEHLGSLRMIPNLWVFRPADGVETAVAYSMALQRKDGPSLFALSRQNLDPIDRGANFDMSNIERGGYVVSEAGGGKQGGGLCLIATGSEVSLAVAAAAQLKESAGTVRVVSMPCAEIFLAQPQAYRDSVIPPGWKRAVVEAGSSRGWMEITGGSPENTLLYGLNDYGASAPAKVLAENFGFTPAHLVSALKTRFQLAA